MALREHLRDRWIADGGEYDQVSTGQLREYRQDAVPKRGWVQCGEQDHEGSVSGASGDLSRKSRPVGLDEAGVDVGEHRGGDCHEVGSGVTLDRAADSAVPSQYVNAIACAFGKCGEQKCRLDTRVKTRSVADSSGRGAAAVENDQNVSVSLWSPGAHHHVGGPGCGPPVDRPDVVPDDVLA